MLKRLPDKVDAMRQAREGRQYRARLPLQDMRRLAPLLNDNQGEIDVNIGLGIGEDGIAHVAGSASATLRVLCQRCMEPMAIDVEAGFRLGLVHSESQGEALPEPYEALLMEEGEISLADVIEDELLLALPQVPMHDEQSCASADIMQALAARMKETEQQAPGKENPFAVLKQLKDQN